MGLLFGCWICGPVYGIFGLEELWKNFGSGQVPAPNGPASSDSIHDLRSFPALVAEIELLVANAVALESLASKTGLKGNENLLLWKKLLGDKLLPQFQTRRAISVVFAGPTKGGKSTVFNNVARQGNLSTTHHVAAATKQNVVAVPKKLNDPRVLQALFPGMQIVPHTTAVAATEDTGETQKLLVREVPNLPEDILLVDTPDFDSDNLANWRKAWDVARLSDVVVMMITPEKHADHSIIEFSQKVVAQSNKPVVLIVNKVHTAQIDRGQWIDWLNTFCTKSGITPAAAYVSPFDLDAAEQGKQSFFRVQGNLSEATTGGRNFSLSRTPSSLHDDLRALNVATLKAQSQVGALVQALEGEGGLSRYLGVVRGRSQTYSNVLKRLRSDDVIQHTLPTPPAGFMNGAILRWWDAKHRSALTRSIQKWTEYLSLNRLIPNTRPLEEKNALLKYQEAQNLAIDQIVATIFQELAPIVLESAHLLSPESQQLLSPAAQGRLLATLKEAYKTERDTTQTFQAVADGILPKWADNHPGLMLLLKGSDILANIVVKPTVVVGSTLAGLVSPTLLGAGVVADNVITTGVTTASANLAGSSLARVVDSFGETVNVELLFTELATTHAANELRWINEWILNHHLAPVMAELEIGAGVVQKPEFQTAETCVSRLGKWASQFQKTGALN